MDEGGAEGVGGGRKNEAVWKTKKGWVKDLK